LVVVVVVVMIEMVHTMWNERLCTWDHANGQHSSRDRGQNESKFATVSPALNSLSLPRDDGGIGARPHHRRGGPDDGRRIRSPTQRIVFLFHEMTPWAGLLVSKRWRSLTRLQINGRPLGSVTP
jgi:hypothetical protein